MLNKSKYQSKGRNITLKKCVVFLSDFFATDKIIVENHNTNNIDIHFDEINLSVERVDFTQELSPILFLHLPNLISRKIHLIDCDVICLTNPYQLNLKLENSQIKMFGKCNFLSIFSRKDSFIDLNDFFSQQIDAVDCLGDISTNIATSSKNLIMKNIHLDIYRTFLESQLLNSSLTDNEKRFYLSLINLIKNTA